MEHGGGIPGQLRQVLGTDRNRVTLPVNRFRPHALTPILSDPHAHAAEEYRKVAVQLGGRRGDAQGRVALVLSALAAEGKTVTAVNVALAFAERQGGRTLLVDADLRRPQVEPFLIEQGRKGLADCLRDGRRLEEVVQFCPRERLHVMTAGTRASEALGAMEPRRLEPLLRELRAEFEWVVCDAPPLLPFAESRTLVARADDVLLVVRAEVTPRAAVSEALALVDEERLAGVVLNAVPAGRWLRYGYRYAYRWRGQSEGPDGKGGA